MSYSLFKVMHVVGVVLLIGNVTVSSVWKVFADRTRCPVTIAYAQRLVTITDWSLTGGGIVLLVIGGYGMAWGRWNLGPDGQPWLFWGQMLFVASGLIWLLVLIPIQTAQSRLSAQFRASEPIPLLYLRLGRQWIVWGVVATVLLLAALLRMTLKA